MLVVAHFPRCLDNGGGKVEDSSLRKLEKVLLALVLWAMMVEWVFKSCSVRIENVEHEGKRNFLCT